MILSFCRLAHSSAHIPLPHHFAIHLSPIFLPSNANPVFAEAPSKSHLFDQSNRKSLVILQFLGRFGHL